MSATYAARASRQSVILAVTAALHAGVLMLVASGLGPRMFRIEMAPPEITVLPPPPKPDDTVEPGPSGPPDFDLQAEPEPPIEIPVVDDKVTPPFVVQDHVHPAAGSGPVVAVAETAPRLHTRDSRLAALINSCYPSASRRLGEEGRAIARITIDGQGRVAHWAVERSSGFPRLDAAMDCVIRRLEFVPGRRDGRGVEAVALLPIVFALD